MKGKEIRMFNPMFIFNLSLGAQIRAWLFRKLFAWIVNTELDELPEDTRAFNDMVLENGTWEDWYRWGKNA